MVACSHRANQLHRPHFRHCDRTAAVNRPAAPSVRCSEQGYPCSVLILGRRLAITRNTPARYSRYSTFRCQAKDKGGSSTDRFVLQSVDDDPAIDALIFEEDTAVMAERALETAAAYVAAAVAFGIGVWVVMGAQAGQEFFAGYLLEQSLSIDNLFVFILVFKYFKTPVDAQRNVLFWGILTAAVLRLIMIVLGVELIQVFEPLLLVFAGILLFSAYKLLAGGDDDEDDDLSDNTVVKLCRRFIKVSDRYDGTKFMTYLQDGTRVFTPLVLVLAVIEISDVIFAVDSIPAVFGITLNPFIVYTSNIFAIISLRAFYSFIAVFMEQLRFLDKAVAIVLGFIGVKMVVDFFWEDLIPTWAALLVVGGVLTGGVAASLLFPAKEDADVENGSNADEVDGEQTGLLSEEQGESSSSKKSGVQLLQLNGRGNAKTQSNGNATNGALGDAEEQLMVPSSDSEDDLPSSPVDATAHTASQAAAMPGGKGSADTPGVGSGSGSDAKGAAVATDSMDDAASTTVVIK